jgi:3-(3-hydroxy-phenyl)propionate hydroxylase
MSDVNYRPATAEKPSSGSGYELPSYPFAVPPELQEVSAKPPGGGKTYPVVVVGGGLSGLTAACDLMQRGVEVVLIDEDNTVGVRGASSRGICYAQKSLEIFKRLGIYQRIKEKGVAWSVGRTLAGDDEVYSFDFATQAASNLSLQPPFINIQQFYIEWFLVDRINELDPALIRWQNRLVNISQTDDLVRLEVETPAGPYVMNAQWVIDCTGLHSPIRESFGLKTNRAEGTDRWCISDVRFKDQKPIERWTWIEANFNDRRAVWQHLMADDVWRLDYQMAPDSDPEYISSPEVVADRLRQHLGADVEFELIWVGPYGYRSHLMETLRHGRVLFAGDAAHVMNPFGARGGNSGIQDADNLGWKLALVLAGKSSSALIDSYHDERHEGAEVNVAITNRTARFLAPRTPVEQMIRNSVIDLARRFPFGRTLVNTGRLSTPSTYTRSAINVGEGGGLSVQNMALPRFDDLVGVMSQAQGNLLIIAPDVNTASSVEAKRLASEYPVRFALLGGTPGGWIGIDDNQGKLTAALKLSTGKLAILRPDLHLAGIVSAGQLEAKLRQMHLLKVNARTIPKEAGKAASPRHAH